MTPDDDVHHGSRRAGSSPASADPSSEMQMHLEVYRQRPDAQAVVHAHPPTATGFAVAGIPLTRAVLAEVVTTLGSMPIAEYATPSTKELPEAVRKYVKAHDGMLLANHGALTLGEGPVRARTTRWRRSSTSRRSASSRGCSAASGCCRARRSNGCRGCAACTASRRRRRSVRRRTRSAIRRAARPCWRRRAEAARLVADRRRCGDVDGWRRRNSANIPRADRADRSCGEELKSTSSWELAEASGARSSLETGSELETGNW